MFLPKSAALVQKAMMARQPSIFWKMSGKHRPPDSVLRVYKYLESNAHTQERDIPSTGERA